MKNEPLITVGMPIYNGQKYLSEAIEGIRNQTYSNWELILLDDASQDRSSEIAQYFVRKESRIRYERKNQNRGLVAARNSIIDLSQGNFLAWNDQDDISLPGRLAAQVRFLTTNPQVGVCGSWTYSGPSMEAPKLVRFPTSWADIAAFMLFYNPMSFNTVLMDLKHLPPDQKNFHDEAGLALDYDLWTRLVLKTEIRNIKRPTSLYRSHSAQNSLGVGSVEISSAALAIQEEFLRNTLDMRWTDDQRVIHAYLTQSPIVWQKGMSLGSIEAYLSALQNANRRVGALGRRNFERVLGYTWLRAIKASFSLPELRQAALFAVAKSPLTRFAPDTLQYRFALHFGLV